MGGGLEPQVWNLATNQVVYALPNPAQALAFNPAGTLLVTGDDEGQLYFWEALTGQPLHTLSAHRGPVLALTFSPDGRTLLSSGEDGMRVWSVAP